MGMAVQNYRIASLFYAGKFLCFKGTSDITRFVLILTYMMQSTPTPILRLLVKERKIGRTKQTHYIWYAPKYL